MHDPVYEFLAEAGWATADRTPIAGDLSARSYFRLQQNGKSAVLMNSLQDAEITTPFVDIGRWLLDIGLSAPHVLAARTDLGLLLLEDFGSDHVSRIMEKSPLRMEGLFDECLRLLLHIRRSPPPDGLRPYRPAELAQWTALAEEYYPTRKPGSLQGFRLTLETVLHNIDGLSAVSLRDFHADNLMWLPDRDGLRRFGLLDFQDAFLTHPVYDLVSLLTDARIDVPRPVRQRAIRRYAEFANEDLEPLELAFAVYSAQRNLRILGVFARAAVRDGKPHHLEKLPRVHNYLSEALEHPVFAQVRMKVLTMLADPADAVRMLAA